MKRNQPGFLIYRRRRRARRDVAHPPQRDRDGRAIGIAWDMWSLVEAANAQSRPCRRSSSRWRMSRDHWEYSDPQWPRLLHRASNVGTVFATRKAREVWAQRIASIVNPPKPAKVV